jgi:MFS family permease
MTGNAIALARETAAQARENSGGAVPVGRHGYHLTAGLLVVAMLGGTLPIPLYVLRENQMGVGPLGVTVIFAAYVAGTLAGLVVFGDLRDHIGRRKVLAIGISCAAVSTAGFLIASGIAPSIGLLIASRIVSGLAAGFVTGTATAALAELQPHRDRQPAAVAASGSNMTALGLGLLIAGLSAEYVALPARSVFWFYLGLCALALAASSASSAAWRPRSCTASSASAIWS